MALLVSSAERGLSVPGGESVKILSRSRAGPVRSEEQPVDRPTDRSAGIRLNWKLLMRTLLGQIVFFCFCAFIAMSAPASISFAEDAPTLRPQLMPPMFNVDGRMKRNLDFWIRIYTQYDTKQGVVHDAKYIDKVFEVLDFRDSKVGQGKRTNQSKAKWKAVLLSVHKKRDKPESMNEEERRIYDLYADVTEPNKFREAAGRKRLRFQLGQKDYFQSGLVQSGRYLPIMEKIFKDAGLPVELTRLPFVESSFNVKARSKVGASGIWQFMRGTGKEYMRVDDQVDERNDPIRATEAAAKLLKQNFESLGSWPLAVTAYNHGRQGVMRAVRQVGSDALEDLVEEYRGRAFGFASSNFFTCLLAAIEAERNAVQYFGVVERQPPLDVIEIALPDSIRLKYLVQFMKLDLATVRELNPGLTTATHRSELPIPAGYQLRLPYEGKTGKEGAIQVFLAGYSEIPKNFKIPPSPKKTGKGRKR